MRIRTGHKPDDWTQNVEGANPGAQAIRGHLVVGVSTADLERMSKRKHKAKVQAEAQA